MLLTGPQPVTFMPTAAVVHIDSIVVDMNLKTYVIAYRDPAGQGQKTLTGALLAATYTSLAALVQSKIEVNEGWTPGSAVAG